MFRRYPLIRQHDQSDCGVAALAMIALWHRIPVNLQRLRALASTDQRGTSLLGLTQAADALGFSTKCVRAEYDVLKSITLPAVAHVKTEQGYGHFVVLYRVTRRAVVLADPGRGISKVPRHTFCECWTGKLLLAAPDAYRRRLAEQPKPLKAWVGVLSLLRGQRSLFIESLIAALLMTLLGLSTSYFVQHLVDSVLVRSETPLLNAMAIGMLMLHLFRAAFGQLHRYLLIHIGRKVDLALVSAYVRHVLDLPLGFFETRRVGEILSRVNDAAKVREAVSGATLTAVVDSMLVIVSAAVLWCYDLPLALVATSFIPLLLLSTLMYHPPTKQRCKEAMECSAQLSSHLIEDIAGVATLKAFGMQRLRAESAERRLARLVQSIFSLQKLGISMGSTGTLLTGIAGIVVLWYGGHRVVDGALTIGQLMFCYTTLGCMLSPLERLASINLKIQDALVAFDRLHQVMELDHEQPQSSSAAAFGGVKQQIELRELSFRYGCQKRVLQDLNLRIPVGATVAFVGESGCGKSTLLRLLMGFYDPTEGQILLDGVDMRDFELQSLRSRISLVDQQPFIFNASIRENIAVGCPAAAMQQILVAARAAGLDEFIAGLPERYETMVGEQGINLSGGQKQRLAIARALLRNPDILLFDEATSHLDTSTERAIQRNLTATLLEKTVIVVAHRLSTIRDADLIVVLHQGQIAEQGTHEQLLERNGRYAMLWKAQTGDAEGSPTRRPPLTSMSGMLQFDHMERASS